MKRILVLNYEFPPLGGGAGNATFYLLKEFANDPEIQIDLVTSSADSYREEQFARNIKVYFLDINKKGNLQYQSLVNLVIYSVKAYLFSKKLQKRHTYDRCHAFFGVPCGYIALKLGLPFIVSLRGSDIPFSNKRFFWLDKLFFKRLSQNVWKRSQHLVVNSKKAKLLVESTACVGQMVDIIPNGVDTNLFAPVVVRRKQETVLKLVSVGRLNAIKGYSYLIDALSGIAEVELALIGDGPLLSELRDLAEQKNVRVSFLGKMSQSEIVPVLQRSDVFISSSLHEGMSNAVLEAMACGLPIITTNTGGAEELVDGNGSIVPVQDSAALRSAVLACIQMPERLLEMSQLSRQKALELSWQNAARRYRNLYVEAA